MKNLFIFSLILVAVAVVFWVRGTTTNDITRSETEMAVVGEKNSTESPQTVSPQKKQVVSARVEAMAAVTDSPAHWQDPEHDADPVLVEKRDNEEKELHALQHMGAPGTTNPNRVDEE
jgi:hypothetical protein